MGIEIGLERAGAAMAAGLHEGSAAAALGDRCAEALTVARRARLTDGIHLEEAVGAVAKAPRPMVTAIIPAFNEEVTVGYVIDAVKRSALVDNIIVVDNASKDRTAIAAAERGVQVLHQPIPGKGQAMQMGAAATDSPILVFLDADLVGLRADHVDQLVQGVLDGAAMTRGTIDRGRVMNMASLHMPGTPVLTGQRAMRREVFEAVDPEAAKGFGIEVGLNHVAAKEHLPVKDMILADLGHRTKETKYANPLEGAWRKTTMFGEVLQDSARLRLKDLARNWSSRGFD